MGDSGMIRFDTGEGGLLLDKQDATELLRLLRVGMRNYDRAYLSYGPDHMIDYVMMRIDERKEGMDG